mmetsp:Transcript_28725/g.74059  ORF Transcript_28725/g.74059 Transcript_28725/m.74059 type:complete len:569 (-) Transcript_28725:948-2654(-)
MYLHRGPCQQGHTHKGLIRERPFLCKHGRSCAPQLRQKSAPKVRTAATSKQQHQWSSGAGVEPLRALLGLEKGSEAELSRVYRRLVASLHPDVNHSKAATKKFKAVNQAYQILKTPELRARAEQQGLRSLGPKYALLQQYLQEHSLADVGQGQRGGDLFTVVGLDLREASTGVETVVSVAAQGTCSKCKGSGMASRQSEDCDVCHGSGEILRTRYNQNGFKALHVGACPACGGKGLKARMLCTSCHGEGRANVRKRVSVKVPAGMDEKRVLRLKGLGNAGVAGGPSGDLVLRFQIHATPNLERHGVDLHSELQICCTSAVLGTIVPVSSVRGLRNLYIPQGTQDGAVICLHGCGLAYAEKGVVRRGHHYFRVSLSVPDGSQASTEVRQLLLQLQQLIHKQDQQQQQQQQLEQQQQLQAQQRLAQAQEATAHAEAMQHLKQQVEQLQQQLAQQQQQAPAHTKAMQQLQQQVEQLQQQLAEQQKTPAHTETVQLLLHIQLQEEQRQQQQQQQQQASEEEREHAHYLHSLQHCQHQHHQQQAQLLQQHQQAHRQQQQQQQEFMLLASLHPG